MPIRVRFDAKPLSEESFKEIAYAVTGVAFSLHNEYGSLFSENHFKHEVVAECRRLGFHSVEAEVPIEVTYADFAKEYFADLIVNDGTLFELKVVRTLTDEHRAQTLNYLFLTGLQRAKLINFGPVSVEQEFVSTKLTPIARKRIAIRQDRWNSKDEESSRLEKQVVDLLKDWGCFLSLPLYVEAIIHLLGGEDRVVQEVSIMRGGVEVSKQKACLINNDTAFKLTAIGDGLKTAEEHIHRFLSHTSLRKIQWINLHHHDVTFTTIDSKN